MTETPLWPELETPGQPTWPRHGRRARQRRKRLTVGVVAGVVSLMAAGGGAYALGVFEPEVSAPSTPSLAAQAGPSENAGLRDGLVAEVADARKTLKGPDGKAAAEPERRALKKAIDDGRRLVASLGSAATPSDSAVGVAVAGGNPDEQVAAATSALRAAVKAVVISGQQARLAQASTELEAARAALRDAAAAGEEAYTDSADMADQAARDALRAALDSAGDVAGEADDLLATLVTSRPATGTTHPAKTMSDLLDRAAAAASVTSEAAARVQDATATLLAASDGTADESETDSSAEGTEAPEDTVTSEETTAPAGTCPEPDQVWSAENGHLSSSELAQIPFAPGHYVRADVAGKLAALNDAYVEQFGVDMTINSSYRTYAEQESLYDPSSKTAAPPGCSNHGTGLAVDIGGGVQAFGSAQYDWLKANAEAYGWVHPPFAEPSGRNPEPWHWQSVLAPNSY